MGNDDARKWLEDEIAYGCGSSREIKRTILQALAERDSLAAECERLRSGGGTITRELLAETAAMRTSSDRYNWLRKHFRFANDSMQELWFDPSITHTDDCDPYELDAAIDKARTAR